MRESVQSTFILIQFFVLRNILFSNMYIPGRVKSFLFSTSSRPALGFTQPPIQWAAGTLYPGIKGRGREADHSPSAGDEVKKMWICTSTPHAPSGHSVRKKQAACWNKLATLLLLASCLAQPSTVKIEVICSYDTSVSLRTTQRYDQKTAIFIVTAMTAAYAPGLKQLVHQYYY
jgi:hypothetical protein